MWIEKNGKMINLDKAIKIYKSSTGIQYENIVNVYAIKIVMVDDDIITFEYGMRGIRDTEYESIMAVLSAKEF